jgi:hypothetical protein
MFHLYFYFGIDKTLTHVLGALANLFIIICNKCNLFTENIAVEWVIKQSLKELERG